MTKMDTTVSAPLYQEPSRLARIQPTAPISLRGGGRTGVGPDPTLAATFYPPAKRMCRLYRLPIKE